MSVTDHDVTPGGDAARALPQIQLVDDGRTMRVLPPVRAAGADDDDAAAPAPSFAPFDFPRVPKTMTDFLALLGDRFRARHGRCVAAVLLLDAATRQWSSAIPAQRCARDAACWSASRADFPTFPRGALLAGSFQTRVLSAGESPADCPPPHDGLHFVLLLGRPGGDPPTIWCFVRAGGATRRVAAADVVVDDLDATIREALPRLTLS
jgi:hypothetical protein